MAASSHANANGISGHTTDKQPLHLRCETKAFEKRAALTPTIASELLKTGRFTITVERDPARIFDDVEYENVGCTLMPHSSWSEPGAVPLTTPVIGLKELPEGTSPISHQHITFAHCYKHQGGWAEVLDRFAKGKGLIYDLEFLTDEKGRRVAAFGFHAGFTGAAVGCLALEAQVARQTRLGELRPYPNEGELVKEVGEKVRATEKKLGRPIRALVMGALGRCGKGAVDLLRKVGVQEDNILKWDMAETAKGGPFAEILDGTRFSLCCPPA